MIPIKVKILVALGAIAAIFFAGVEWSDRGWEAKASKAAEKLADLNSANIRLTLDVEREQARSEYLLLESVNDVLESHDEETRKMNDEKIAYRKNPDAGSCAYPADGVQRINRATSTGVSQKPPASGTASARPKSFTDIEITDSVVDNYRHCGKERVKYLALWQWAVDNADTQNQPLKK